MLHDILPRLEGMKYLILIDVSSGYHNLKLDEKLYLTFSCLFGRYQYVRLPFGAASAGDMVWKKTVELFSSMLNVSGIADDLLIAGFDEYSRSHNEMLEKVLQICRQVNLKLNKDICLFRCTSIPFFGEIISQQSGIQTHAKFKH